MKICVQFSANENKVIDESSLDVMTIKHDSVGATHAGEKLGKFLLSTDRGFSSIWHPDQQLAIYLDENYPSDMKSSIWEKIHLTLEAWESIFNFCDPFTS